ncbi:MAG: trypsin-like peptidase domain-containing protein [Planctomycetota bacterium]
MEQHPQESGWNQQTTTLKRQLALTWVLMVLLAIFLLLPSIISWFNFGSLGQPRAVTPRGALGDFEETTVKIFDEVSPSVVYINTQEQYRNIFTHRVEEKETGTGSGFVWDQEGHIVTNYHVIEGADSAQVFFSDQSSYEAIILAASPSHDLAVLKINAPQNKLRPVLIGESNSLKVGQSVFAIGNPFGLDQTLTTGIVSAKSRSIQSPTGSRIDDVIQIDAAINPGNSGGPLMDSAGRLIGVNTAIYSPSGTSAGVGFAIPVDIVNRVVPQIIQRGEYAPPRLGVSIREDLNEDMKRQTGIQGVVILETMPGGPAASVGMQGSRFTRRGFIVGDIIQKIGTEKVTSVEQFQDVMQQYRRGQEVTVTFFRDDRVYEVDVTLE